MPIPQCHTDTQCQGHFAKPGKGDEAGAGDLFSRTHSGCSWSSELRSHPLSQSCLEFHPGLTHTHTHTSKPAPRPGQALSSQDLELNQILPFPRGVHGLLGQVAMEHSMTAQRYASNWNVLTTCYVPVTILNLD